MMTQRPFHTINIFICLFLLTIASPKWAHGVEPHKPSSLELQVGAVSSSSCRGLVSVSVSAQGLWWYGVSGDALFLEGIVDGYVVSTSVSTTSSPLTADPNSAAVVYGTKRTYILNIPQGISLNIVAKILWNTGNGYFISPYPDNEFVRSVWISSPTGGGSSCNGGDDSGGGGPSGGDGPNGPSGPSGTAGDPVDLYTGRFQMEKTDQIVSDIIPITLTRIMQSNFYDVGPFGIGVSHSYDISLSVGNGGLPSLNLNLPNGGRLRYDLISQHPFTSDAVYEHTTSHGPFYKSQVKWNVVDRNWVLTKMDGMAYRFGEDMRLVGMKDRYDNIVTVIYTDLKISRITSSNGRWLEFSYETPNCSLCISRVVDSLLRTVLYEYDELNRLKRVVDVNDGSTEYTYTTFPADTPSVYFNYCYRTPDCASGGTLQLLVLGRSTIETIKDARGIVFLKNEYYDSGRVKKQTLANNKTYEFVYTKDASGKVIQTDVTDPRGIIRRATFNDNGYIVTDTQAFGTPEAQTTRYERDPEFNEVRLMINPLGRKTAYTYDPNWNVQRVTTMAETTASSTTEFTYLPGTNRLASVTDFVGTTTFQEAGSQILITNPMGKVTTIGLNAAGQPISIKNPLQHESTFEYNNGYMATRIDPMGNKVQRLMDGAGRLTELTDPRKYVTKYVYDPLNRLKQITDAKGGVIGFGYDLNGNLLTVTDAKGNATAYTYDVMDYLGNRTDPLQRTEGYEYDGNGNLIRFTDRKGQVSVFEYDLFDHRVKATYGDGGTTTYNYDAVGRLTVVNDSVSGTIVLSHDDLNRQITETTSQGIITYGFDPAGRRMSMTATGQTPVTYTYDDADRPLSIRQGSAIVSFVHDDAGRRTSLTYPNETVTGYSYDNASRLTGITYKKGASLLGDLIYDPYDEAGNRKKVRGTWARTGFPQAVSSATYNEANQMITFGSQTFTYDANGNLVNDGTKTYSWDARNRLVGMSGSSVSASFMYDALGRRISKTINGTTTEYLYDGNDIVAEIQGGVVTTTYLRGLNIDEPFMRTTPTGNEYYHTDALGSVLALTDQTGTVQTRYAYDPFGNTTVTGTSTNPFQYTGRENDQPVLSGVEGGLYYYRARYYSPTLQRFISEDPIGFYGGDVNFYTYVLNNPIRFRDPFGLWTVGGGVAVSGGAFGLGGSVDVSLVIDGNGQVGIVGTIGGGGYGGMGGSVGLQGQVTNAQNIQQLGGPGGSTSISGGSGLVFSGGTVHGGGYNGGTGGVGGGIGTGASGSGNLTNTKVWCIFKCSGDTGGTGNGGAGMGGRKR